MESFREEEAIAIKRCRGGSRRAFETIVRRYMRDAYFIALGLVGNREDALDLSQEAFVRVYQNLEHLNPNRRFFPWFYQILRNLCFSHLRKTRVEREHFVDDFGDTPLNTDSAGSFAPDLLAETNEVRANLWAAIGKLDDKHREVIVLRHFRNLSYEEIAETLFCNKGTVTSILYYARKRLKEILDSQKGGRQE